MRLLIVEDENALRQQLSSQLKKQGYAIDEAHNGKDGVFLGEEYDYDAAVVDLGLPDICGIDIIERWRKNDRSFPVLILTARGRWQEKVEGLEAGADDYLVKPFHYEELLARLKALLRRSSGRTSNTISADPVFLDISSQTVSVNKAAVDLTAYEYRTLEYLMLHNKKVISKTELTEHIYDQDFDRDSNVIEVFIGRLRRKLDPQNTLKPIETLRGRGYRFSLSITE